MTGIVYNKGLKSKPITTWIAYKKGLNPNRTTSQSLSITTWIAYKKGLNSN